MGECCPDFEQDRSKKCRCQNTTDPQKIYSYVLQAIRHWDCGNGATPLEIRCYIQKNHRVCMGDQELGCAIKEALKKAICVGAVRRRYCDGKYYMAKMSSGRCRRIPPACVVKCPPPCRKPKCSPPPPASSSSSRNGCDDDDDEDDDACCGATPQSIANRRCSNNKTTTKRRPNQRCASRFSAPSSSNSNKSKRCNNRCSKFF